MALNRTWNGLLLGACCAALTAGSASAAVISSKTPMDFTGKSVSFGFDGADIVFGSNQDFTFSDNGTVFPDSVDITTGGGAQVAAFGGFLGIPVTPSSLFNPVRGFGSTYTFGPGQYASFSTPTPIAASSRGFYLGLTETLSDGVHYGFAEVADGGKILQSVAFESVAGRNIVTPVPLPASAPLFGAALIGLAGLGYAAKRKKTAAV